MRPFNLEEALAGKPVVTRDGRQARIAGYNKNALPTYSVVGWVGKGSLAWDKDGKIHDQEENSFDLFMSPQKKWGWINLYKKGSSTLTKYIEVQYSKQIAEVIGKRSDDYICTIKIEWEE